MTTETVLSNAQIKSMREENSSKHTAELMAFTFARAIEQAVLQSPEIQALRRDAALLDWLEQQTNESPTGTSFDYVRQHSGLVFEQGYRFMRRRFLGERRPTIREAIDAAMETQT